MDGCRCPNRGAQSSFDQEEQVMKAVALRGVGNMELVDVTEPEAGPGELKLRIRHCGVCGSDLHEFQSAVITLMTNRQSPIMGHEFSGEVVAVGTGVEGFTVGDLATVNPQEPCGECLYCKSGRGNLCLSERVLGLGYHTPGAFAEYVSAKASRAVKVAPDAPSDQLALTEPLAVAMHALNQGDLQRGETVFVAGAGPIGALCVAAARRAGAGRVIVSEPAAKRRALAQSLGADEVIDPSQAPAAPRVLELTEGLGVDLAVECVGIAAALDDCAVAARRGGRIVVAGVFEQPTPILLLRTMVFEHHIVGAFAYRHEFAEAAQLIASGQIDVSPVISRIVSLEQVPAIFDELSADRDRYHKVLVSPEVDIGK
jgi:(R,R)-butanediol dehydrogenase/meso-butanediol dehydrogenase/diacetyl reductase